jgi:ribosome-binding protein aMBF1 (putative translation factor)
VDKQLDVCRECYAYVDSTTRHRSWHQEQERKIRMLEQAIHNMRQ